MGEGEDTLANLASCQANNSSFLSGGYRNPIQSQYSYSNPGTPESPVHSPSSPGSGDNSNDQDYDAEYLINNLMDDKDKEKLMEMLSQNTADMNIENVENCVNMNMNFHNFDGIPTMAGPSSMSGYPANNVSSIQDHSSDLNQNTFPATCDHVGFQNVNTN